MLFCDLSLITKHISDCCQFSDIHISQGSVATYLRCGGIFKYDFVENLPMSLPVKKFWKSVNIWGSYGQEFSVLFFWDTVHMYDYRTFSAATHQTSNLLGARLCCLVAVWVSVCQCVWQRYDHWLDLQSLTTSALSRPSIITTTWAGVLQLIRQFCGTRYQ